MLRTLRLKDFKNFHEAELKLGPLTVLVGMNATGKSNIRDAFRFLHGVSRGYTLAEIIGEKWIEGGVLQWRGIRGGTREVCFNGSRSFSLSAEFDFDGKPPFNNSYVIQVGIDKKRPQPLIRSERLDMFDQVAFYSCYSDRHYHLTVQLPVKSHKEKGSYLIEEKLHLLDFKPVLSQIAEHPKLEHQRSREYARQALKAFESMRFLDLNPEAMRNPSVPGQTILGDRGENLSSVLQAICADPGRKAMLLDWIRALTPMDATDFEFTEDATGKILLSLVDGPGRRISAHSASDGTLRFLAMIAALLGPHPARFYFFEELDNGILSWSPFFGQAAKRESCSYNWQNRRSRT